MEAAVHHPQRPFPIPGPASSVIGKPKVIFFTVLPSVRVRVDLGLTRRPCRCATEDKEYTAKAVTAQTYFTDTLAKTGTMQILNLRKLLIRCILQLDATCKGNQRYVDRVPR